MGYNSILIGLFLFIGFHNFTRPNALMGSTKTRRELLSSVVSSKGSVGIINALKNQNYQLSKSNYIEHFDSP